MYFVQKTFTYYIFAFIREIAFEFDQMVIRLGI